jgi:hypothetical protein
MRVVTIDSGYHSNFIDATDRDPNRRPLDSRLNALRA